jgi:hypothetical protein
MTRASTLLVLLLLLGSCRGSPPESPPPTAVAPAVEAPAVAVSAAVARRSWSARSAGGHAQLVQTASSEDHCVATCSAAGRLIWSVPGCVASATDFAFVEEDCGFAAVIFEYPQTGAPPGTAQVGVFLTAGNPRPLRLESVMADVSKVVPNDRGTHFRWLLGVLGQPGQAPQPRAGGGGVEFGTLDGERHTFTFRELLAAKPLPPPPAPPPAAAPPAALYEWEDTDGSTRVTTLAEVPEARRKRARAITAELSVVNGSGPSRPSRRYDAAPSGSANTAAEERSWRSRFANARQRLADVEAAVTRAQQTVTRLDGAVGSGRFQLTPAGVSAYENAKATLSSAEAARARAQDDMHDLDRQAANASVPLEWRR